MDAGTRGLVGEQESGRTTQGPTQGGLEKVGGVSVAGGQVPDCHFREVGGEGLPSGSPHWLNGPILG